MKGFLRLSRPSRLKYNFRSARRTDIKVGETLVLDSSMVVEG